MNPKIKKHGLFLLGIAVCFAVAAIVPVIDADDKDIAFAISSTFLFDMVMVALAVIWCMGLM